MVVDSDVYTSGTVMAVDSAVTVMFTLVEQ